MLSLPIPEPESPITYGDCFIQPGVSFADFFDEMGVWWIRDKRNATAQRLDVGSGPGVRLDPDLRFDARADRPVQWQPLFGQADIAARQLAKTQVGPGDIFLFFGWFAATEYRDGQLRHRRGVPRFQAMWDGWRSARSHARTSSQPAIPWAAGQRHLTLGPHHGRQLILRIAEAQLG